MKVVAAASGALVVWLGILHVIISHQALIPTDISGIGFLVVTFAGAGVFGAGILLTPVGRMLAGMDQSTLRLAQGIRVYFGSGVEVVTPSASPCV